MGWCVGKIFSKCGKGEKEGSFAVTYLCINIYIDIFGRGGGYGEYPY